MENLAIYHSNGVGLKSRVYKTLDTASHQSQYLAIPITRDKGNWSYSPPFSYSYPIIVMEK